MKRKLKGKVRSGNLSQMDRRGGRTKSVRPHCLPGHRSLGFRLSAWRGGSMNFLPKVRNTKDRPSRDRIYATGQWVWHETTVGKGSHARD